MFGRDKKKKNVKDLLAMAEKVYNYRCDVVGEQNATHLHQMIEQLNQFVLDSKVDTKECKDLCEKLERHMRVCGGKIYPLTTWADNVDMIVVAGILAIGVRSFFLQPFKIPTNSMYPSFYGMTSQVFDADTPPPSIPEKIAGFIFKGASNYSEKAPADGELLVEINRPDQANAKGGLFAFDLVPVREFFVWPTQERRYKFEVDGKQISLAVPADFSMDTVIPEAFPIAGKGNKDLGDFLKAADLNGKIIAKNEKLFVKLGNVKKGQNIINFDILSGDMLFVDRFTYNFKKPEIGDAIVFKTKYCEGLTRMNNGVEDDKYYIKRLVGKGSDVLKIEGSTLMRNGQPAKGSVAFEANAKKLGDYCGYKQDGDLKDGNSVEILPDHYYAMGDNSANSLDSRYWGQVPKQAIVGKSLIIFYPFTKRWGASK